MRVYNIIRQIEKEAEKYLYAKKIVTRVDDGSQSSEEWLEERGLREDEVLLVNIKV